MSVQATPENSGEENEGSGPAGQNTGTGDDDLIHGGPTEERTSPSQTEDERRSEESVTDPSNLELGAED
ncbi:MAG TPA: hypothetical protein VHB69_08705 [Mycobacteriales bacterium]|nr:hypothetical protein [Mycobacteriales bacterium]